MLLVNKTHLCAGLFIPSFDLHNNSARVHEAFVCELKEQKQKALVNQQAREESQKALSRERRHS